MSYVRVKLDGYDEIKQAMKDLEKGAQKTLDYTMRDFRRSMPGWIASEVIKEYNVGKQSITSSKIGTVKAVGNGMESAIIFGGRLLTPIHFGMKPKKMKAPKKLSKKDRMKVPGGEIKFKGKAGQVATLKRAQQPYEVSWEIKRGDRKTPRGDYNTPWYIAPAAKGSDTQIPFQRSPGHPKGFATVAAHTVSLPQMVSHDGRTLKPEIAKEVWPKLEEKLAYNSKRFLGK